MLVHAASNLPQIIQKLISQSLPFMCPRHEARDIEQLYWHAAGAIDAGAVIRLAPCLQPVSRTGAGDLEIANGALWIDGGETVDAKVLDGV